MAAVSSVSKQAIPHMFNVSMTLPERDFFKRFGQAPAKLIGTDERTSVEGEKKSITSYDIGDCITLFAIEKENGRINAIFGWHIQNGTSVEELKGNEGLNDYLYGKVEDSDAIKESDASQERQISESGSSEEEKSEPKQISQKTYQLYIIGGNASTIQGTGCLLDNIHTAIQEFFFEGTYKIESELIDIAAKNSKKFVSANLQTDGTLTLCFHNIRHGD